MTYRLIVLCLALFLIGSVDSRKFRSPIYDDYGWEINDGDCPRDKSLNPVISIRNESHSHYFALTCYASYPITVEFNGQRFNKASVRSLLTSASPSNSTKACYMVHFTSYAYYSSYSPVGTYICKSVTSPQKATSAYVFAKDSWRFPAFNALSNQVLHVNTKKVTKLTLACPSSKETLTQAVLMKYDPLVNTKFNLANDKDLSISYNQKVGFTVEFSGHRTENSSDPEGIYLCKDPADLEGPDAIEFEVKHSEFVALPNKTTLTFGQGPITLECYGTEPVSIKVLDSTSPFKSVVDSTIPDNYTQAGYSYGTKLTFEISDPTIKGQIACTTTEKGKQLFVWKFDNEYRCKCEWNASINSYYTYGGYDHTPSPEYGESPDSTYNPMQNNDWTFYDPGMVHGELTCYNDKAVAVDWTLIPCKNPIECQLMRSCLEGDECPYLNDYSYYSERKMNRTSRVVQLAPGLLRCVADNYISVMQVSTDMENNMYFDGRKPKKLIDIKVAEHYLYSGDKIIFACRTSDFYVLSNKITWAFGRGQDFDEKSSMYPEFDSTSFHDGRYYGGGGGADDRIASVTSGSVRTSFITIPSKEFTKLWCLVPRQNEDGWEKTSVDLKIQAATPAQNPPKCPTGVSPFIVMLRNSSSISSQRVRLPHIVDASSDQSIFDPVESISLYCLAKYPVQWMKDGVNVTSAVTKRSNCNEKNGYVLKNRLYKSTVVAVIGRTNSSGNYTCRSTTPHQSRQASVYIFAIGHENRTSFINEGHHYQIYHEYKNQSKEFNKWAVIPCRLNNPKATPYLFVDHAEEERMEFINFDRDHLKFDTKIGFSIDVTSRFVRNVTTSFICSDHKDGSFIGNIVTLRLVHDINATLLTTPKPGSDSSTDIPVTSKPTSKPTPTPTTTKPPVKVETSSSSGFVVSIVLLTSLCFACFGVIYYLYQKIVLQQKKNPPLVTQELDWANATNHITTGNNIQNFTYPQSTDATETITENKIDNQAAIHIENHVDNHANDDSIIKFESLPNISENDFNYKQF